MAGQKVTGRSNRSRSGHVGQRQVKQVKGRSIRSAEGTRLLTNMYKDQIKPDNGYLGFTNASKK
jgi:hypothetical protein